LDLSNISDIEKCAATLQTMVFRAVVLCAVDYGADQRHPAANTSAREWQQVIGTNCVGHCILVSQLLQNLLSDPPGIIVNLSSDVAVLPGAGRAAYAASKAGLHALLRAIAEEHPRDQLRVYQLIPTFQLITNGIRRRRPAGFDFSSYVEPVAVAQVVDRLISSSDSPAPPGTYLVDRDGTMKHYLENTKL
jgi:NAD(P)-dependent dehydrogenase (short-subunit alcohol dehydrogenase family)